MIPLPMTSMLFQRRLFKPRIGLSPIFGLPSLSVTFQQKPGKFVKPDHLINLHSNTTDFVQTVHSALKLLASKDLCRTKIGKMILHWYQQRWCGGGRCHSKPSVRNRGFFSPLMLYSCKTVSWWFTHATVWDLLLENTKGSKRNKRRYLYSDILLGHNLSFQIKSVKHLKQSCSKSARETLQSVKWSAGYDQIGKKSHFGDK